MKSKHLDHRPKAATEGESSASKSDAANEALQTAVTAVSDPASAESQEDEGGEGVTASMESNRPLTEEIKVDEDHNESIHPSVSATSTAKKRKKSVEIDVAAGESTRKRRREEFTIAPTPIPQETGSLENCTPAGNLETAQVAPSPAPLVAQPHNSFNSTLVSQTPYLVQQLQASSLSSLSQLPLPMQSALLSFAAASVGPVHPGNPPDLATLLALQQLQQASRLAAANQLMASNPLASQIFLQHLLGASSGITTPAMSMPPLLGGNFGQIFLPWAGMYNGAPALPPFAHQGHPFSTLDSSGTGLPGCQLQVSGLPPRTSSNGQATTSAGGPMAPSPAPLYLRINGGAVAARGFVSSSSSLQQSYTVENIGPEVPESLPVVLALTEDDTKLSAYQILLRNQIEAFAASTDELATHTKGRNKPISLRQVGIRCRHCKHVALNRRKKGSVYFPFSLLGLYQAAQNMGSSHFYDGESCNEMSTELKEKFVESIACRSTAGSGKQYWAKSAGKLGLVDTDHGIRFIRDLVVASS